MLRAARMIRKLRKLEDANTVKHEYETNTK
jgi:hypothetical protein